MKRSVSLILIGVTTLACGCAHRAPAVDDRFGATVRELRARHAIEPTPANAQDQATGIDARAARESYNVYVNSFRAPPAPMTVFNFGIGASSGR